MVAAVREKTRLESTVLSLRSALTAGSLTLLVGMAAMSVLGQPQPTAPADQLGLSSRGLDKMLERHHCSTTGFGSDVIPAKAVVTQPDGSTDLVSFDYGWQVFNGDKPGRLVAVCLGRTDVSG
ncbi:MAG TPA: hypothetical protein VNS55_05640 [Nocardioides sp.]|nr:hypothetical protein [Nocardioides sp.]